jgi:hypothetical protein
MIEIAAAGFLLVTPHPVLFGAIAAWKIGVEMLYPLSGAPIWEVVERGGSYGAPLALAILSAGRYRLGGSFRVPAMRLFAPVFTVLLTALFPSLAGAQQDRTPIAPSGIADSLRRGGFVLVCRHAITNHEQTDRGPTREQQRNLSADGEAQAKSIGAAIRALEIPIGDVLANPMYRTQETATLAFGHMVIDSTLAGRGNVEVTRALLAKVVPSGTNRAIVTRIGPLSSALEDHGVREIEEGDCFAVRPTSGGTDFRVLGRIRSQDWGKLGSR